MRETSLKKKYLKKYVVVFSKLSFVGGSSEQMWQLVLCLAEICYFVVMLKT